MPLIDGVYAPAAAVDVNEGISADVEAAVAAATGLRLVGVSVRESAGTAAAATVRIMEGATVAAGTGIMTIELAANEERTIWLWPGIECEGGLTIDVIAGTVDVYLYHITVV